MSDPEIFVTARDVREFREHPDAMIVTRGEVVYVVTEDYYRRCMQDRPGVRIVMTHPDLRAIAPESYEKTDVGLAEIITEVENDLRAMHNEPAP